MKIIHYLIVLVLGMMTVGCDSTDSEARAHAEKLPFTINERDGKLTYSLRLPDKGSILLMADTIGDVPAITAVSISSSEGLVYAADYSAEEFLIFNPETKAEVIYLKSDDGYTRAPESVQERYRQASQMFSDWATKHIGSYADTNEGVEDLKILRNQLNDLNKPEE